MDRDTRDTDHPTGDAAGRLADPLLAPGVVYEDALAGDSLGGTPTGTEWDTTGRGRQDGPSDPDVLALPAEPLAGPDAAGGDRFADTLTDGGAFGDAFGDALSGSPAPTGPAPVPPAADDAAAVPAGPPPSRPDVRSGRPEPGRSPRPRQQRYPYRQRQPGGPTRQRGPVPQVPPPPPAYPPRSGPPVPPAPPFGTSSPGTVPGRETWRPPRHARPRGRGTLPGRAAMLLVVALFVAINAVRSCAGTGAHRDRPGSLGAVRPAAVADAPPLPGDGQRVVVRR